MAEIYVTSTADSGSGSLRQAIADAQDGDRILFDETVFPAGIATSIYLSSFLSVAKDIEIDGDGRVEIDGQNATRCMALNGAAHVKNLMITRGATTNGAGVLMQGGTPTMTNCYISFCRASGVCGGVYVTSNAVATLNNCVVDSCTAGTNGGGVYFNNTSQTTMNDCKIFGCSSDGSGGGLIGASDSQAVLNRCNIQVCRTANYGGAAYIFGAATVSFVDCTTSNNTSDTAARRGVAVGGTATVSFTSAQVEALLINPGTTATIADGLSTVGTLTLVANADGAPTVTFLDGAALSVTSDATIPSAATFTSETRGYLALASGLDASAATFNNVVLCSYGAGASRFREDLGVLRWDAADVTVPVLLEYEADVDGAAQWETLIQTTGNSYTRYFGPSVNLRLFDGEKFLTTSTPSSRTYYYIGGAEGSFTAAADWSLTRGGYAIPEPPTVKGCTFIVGDVAEPTTEEETTEETSEP